jgi:UDP:flavonoid glycosyltransferase YjiC (YdhE family)
VNLPAWSDHLADLPTVYVTLGTVYNQTRGLIETILAALGQREFNLIVTIGAERDRSGQRSWAVKPATCRCRRAPA